MQFTTISDYSFFSLLQLKQYKNAFNEETRPLHCLHYLQQQLFPSIIQLVVTYVTFSRAIIVQRYVFQTYARDTYKMYLATFTFVVETIL